MCGVKSTCGLFLLAECDDPPKFNFILLQSNNGIRAYGY